MSEAPPHPEIFGAAGRALEAGLRERGLEPRQDERHWQTGVAGLELEQGEAAALELGTHWFGHIEMVATLDHPTFGQQQVQDRISLDGANGEAVLTECVDLYLKMVFDPLSALFDPDRFAAPAADIVVVVEPDTVLNWRLFCWGVDLRGEQAGLLHDRLERHGALGLVGSSLCGCLTRPRLHWCKLYAERLDAGTQVGCILDGQRAAALERELAAGLADLPEAGTWALRGFLVLAPAGEPDPGVAADLRGLLAQHAKPKRWWQFGRPRRVAWKSIPRPKPEG